VTTKQPDSNGPTHVTLRLPYLQHPRGDKVDFVLEGVSIEALRANGFVPESELIAANTKLLSGVRMPAAGGTWVIGGEDVWSLLRDAGAVIQKHIDQSTSWDDERHQLKGQIQSLIAERDALRVAINRDRTGLAAGLNHVRSIVKGYWWIAEGTWGSYDYTQHTTDTLQREVKFLIESVCSAASGALRASGDRANAALRSNPRHAEALANPPGPMHAVVKDSSPSSGVPVAAVDSETAKPREATSATAKATDNPGDGAGAEFAGHPFCVGDGQRCCDGCDGDGCQTCDNDPLVAWHKDTLSTLVESLEQQGRCPSISCNLGGGHNGPCNIDHSKRPPTVTTVVACGVAQKAAQITEDEYVEMALTPSPDDETLTSTDLNWTDEAGIQALRVLIGNVSSYCGELPSMVATVEPDWTEILHHVGHVEYELKEIRQVIDRKRLFELAKRKEGSSG
jgi:hypothetical protein